MSSTSNTKANHQHSSINWLRQQVHGSMEGVLIRCDGEVKGGKPLFEAISYDPVKKNKKPIEDDKFPILDGVQSEICRKVNLPMKIFRTDYFGNKKVTEFAGPQRESKDKEEAAYYRNDTAAILVMILEGEYFRGFINGDFGEQFGRFRKGFGRKSYDHTGTVFVVGENGRKLIAEHVQILCAFAGHCRTSILVHEMDEICKLSSIGGMGVDDATFKMVLHGRVCRTVNRKAFEKFWQEEKTRQIGSFKSEKWRNLELKL